MQRFKTITLFTKVQQILSRKIKLSGFREHHIFTIKLFTQTFAGTDSKSFTAYLKRDYL